MKLAFIAAAIGVGAFLLLLTWALCCSASVGDERIELMRREQAKRDRGE